MQSLSRKFKRGNAIIIFSNVTKQNEVVEKKGCTKKRWDSLIRTKEALTNTMNDFCENVTKPLSRSQIKESKSRSVFC